ncbi:MAG: hypothetical protein JST58_20040 [Bacteroidetes bacterium]|nr:hypothetical protein [Bacteroidota bacterium]
MEIFEIQIGLLNKNAVVKKSPFFLTVINEQRFNVSVDRVPLIEYFVLIAGKDKTEDIKIKVYRNIADGKWYDENYSVDSQFNSPEFGIPSINSEVKKLIDSYENHLVKI